MTEMLPRESALELVREHVKRGNLIKHVMAVEAIMRALAKELMKDEELWGLAGLLHDIDFDETYNDAKRHGLRSVEIIEEEMPGRVPEEVIGAIKAHNPEHSGRASRNEIDFALLAADAVSGLIIASALGLPSKKLADLKPDSVARRFRERDFAERCSRENMMLIERLGLSKEILFELSLKALQGIHLDLDL